MVTAYFVNHKAFAEDCGCTHYIAQAFDGQGNNNQLQASAPVLKLQDYVPAHASPALAALPAPASAPPLMAPGHYSYRALTDVFRPPCITTSLFMI